MRIALVGSCVAMLACAVGGLHAQGGPGSHPALARGRSGRDPGRRSGGRRERGAHQQRSPNRR